MENTYHDGKGIHGELRGMDGAKGGRTGGLHAIWVRAGGIPQAGRHVQDGEGDVAALQGHVQKGI